MTDRPVLVDSGVGVLGAVITVPDGPPKAAAVILHGSVGSRAGTNQVWFRMARALGEMGVVTIRSDYPGLGESHQADSGAKRSGAQDLVHWFRERTGDVDLLVIALCYGLLPAVEVVRNHRNVAGVAVIAPPWFPSLDHSRPSTVRQAARWAARRVASARRLPRETLRRARYGRSSVPDFSQDVALLAHIPELLSELVGNAPVWLLKGERDPATPGLRELAEAGRCRLEVVEGCTLHPYTEPWAQEAIFDRTLAWAERCLQPVETAP